MKNPKKILKLSVLIFFTIIISGYIIFQARNIIIGPVIKIEAPTNGSRLRESLVEIKGVAKNISYISMNDKQIFTDDNGVFSEKLLLSRGYNIIMIKAVDRFDREIQKKLELIYYELRNAKI